MQQGNTPLHVAVCGPGDARDRRQACVLALLQHAGVGLVQVQNLLGQTAERLVPPRRQGLSGFLRGFAAAEGIDLGNGDATTEDSYAAAEDESDATLRHYGL